MLIWGTITIDNERKTENRIHSAKTHSGSWIHYIHDNSCPKCQGNDSQRIHVTFMPKQQEPINAKTVAAGAFAATVSFQAENATELPGKKTCFSDVKKLES